jgi:S1-C subfamily serine protease
MKKYLLVLLLVIFIIPSIASASWWNPFSWFRKNTKPVEQPTVQVQQNNPPTKDTPKLIKNKVSEKKTASSISNTATNPAESNLISKTEVQSLTSIKFDNAVIRSSLMIQIFDNRDRFVSGGSGISLGGMGNILTNYHVVTEEVFLNPNGYKVYGCVTVSLNIVPECNYILSTTRKLLSGNITSAQYSKDLDLALLYIDQVKVNGKWLSVIDTSLDNLKDRSINLSSYTKKYNDLAVGSPVYSVGYPDFGGEKTIQVDGVVKEIGKNQSGKVWVLTTLNISHGNSGGPVFNSKGELVGVTVACRRVVPDNDDCKTFTGLFIPLPSVNWWYTKASNSHIIEWEGKNYYSSNNGISDDTQKATLCILENNAHYDSKISTNSCTCNTGYTKNFDNKCVNNSGVVDPPKTPYGQARDLEAEKKALGMLDNLFSELSQGSTNTAPPTTPAPPTDQIKLYINNNFNPAKEKFNNGLEYTNKGLDYAAQRLRVDAEKYFNYSIESFNNAASILGENPPAGWVQTHNCMVSLLINSVTASVYLKSSLYYSGTPKAMEYITTAQTFTHKADQDKACVSNTTPTTP